MCISWAVWSAKKFAEAALSSLRKLRKGFYIKPEETEACEKFSPVKDIIT